MTTWKAKLITGNVIAANAAVATGKLAQIANGFIYDNETTAQRVHEEKTEWLRDLIEQAAGPTLLIYEFIEDLDIDAQAYPPICNASGKWPTPISEDTDTIAAWNKGSLPFLALHPASGGHGLNLQHGGADMAWIVADLVAGAVGADHCPAAPQRADQTRHRSGLYSQEYCR